MHAPKIDGIELEELIRRAADREPQALDDLLYSDWMTKRFNYLSDWVERQYGLDGRAVTDYIFDRIRARAQPPDTEPLAPWLDNPHQSSWRSCLNQWTATAAKNRSLGLLKHYEVESRHAAALRPNHPTQGEHGSESAEPSASTLSPEEEVMRKEEHAIVGETIREKAFHTYDSSTEEEQRIVSLWASGMKLREIAVELNSSIETVRRKLKNYQRTFYEEVRKGIAEKMGEEKTRECNVEQVLGKIVKKREDLNDLLPPHAQAPSPPEPKAPRKRRTRARRRKPPDFPMAA